MKTLFAALALAAALPAAAQTAPAAAADPHAGHGQHHTAPSDAQAQMDHARMMEMCKDPKASAEMRAHCAEMMKHHGHQQAAPAEGQAPQPQHSH